ncbi:MAG: tRNA (cytidine(34)-2'-O)-methyltransferase [Sandaracinaceae bacterium]|nr:tRNA (cytidine(34)-2'-O)-methyltransferase [Sandaracinaceae bacterium]
MPRADKLRYRAGPVPFRIVLVEPEIPPNTGAIARTCVATDTPLHLVGPLGFDISDHAVRRAGLDYWPKLDLHRHDDFDAFRQAFPDARPVLFTANASRSYLDADLAPGDALVFGRESVGLPKELVARFDAVAIPTAGHVRSLNLSNAVAIALYEGLRRSGALSDTYVEPP